MTCSHKDLGVNESEKVMVKSIINVPHSINMEVVAEFVENDLISQLLKKINID